MQLNYRRATYQIDSLGLEATETEVIGKYRGAQLKRSHFNLPQQQAGVELTFLGNRYCR